MQNQRFENCEDPLTLLVGSVVDGGQRKSENLFALAGSPPCMAKINKGTLVNVQKNLIPINLPI